MDKCMKLNLFLLSGLAFFLTSNANSSTEDILPYIRNSRNYEVNKEISPCADFYNYACSKVINDFKLPENRPAYIFAFSDSAESLLTYKKNYFKKLATINPENKKEKLLKDIYVACMNPDASKADELVFLNKVKNELEKLSTKEELLKFLAYKNISEQTSFFHTEVIRNQDDSFYTDVVILPTLMSFPERSYYDNKDLQKEYEEILADLFSIIGRKDPKASAKFVFQFEKEFAQVFPTPLEIRTVLSQKTKISKLDLLKYKNLKLDNLLQSIPNKTLIRNIAPKTYSFIDEKLASLSVDEIKDIYFALNIKDILDDSYPEYFKKYYTFQAKYFGLSKERPDREERCTNLVMGSFPMELDYILTPKIFPDFPRERVIKMANSVRAQIVKTLKENKWLSKKGKMGAIKKMQSAPLYLVSPENDVQWNFKPEIKYSATTPVQNILNLKLAITNQNINELGKKLPKDRWEIGPLEVNAYYQPSFNQFVLPVAILQKPMFDKDQSDLQNIAAIGSVIGHELGHGIDDNGRRYDYQGKLHDWVTPKDIENLKKHTTPLIDQFNKIGHNGALTLGENIGDLVGLTNSFRIAFPDYKVGKYKQEQLQDFFLQYARMWCEVQTDSFKEKRLKTDPHSLGFARTNEQLKQQIGFREAYSCKKGDPMFLDEDKLISIW